MRLSIFISLFLLLSFNSVLASDVAANNDSDDFKLYSLDLDVYEESLERDIPQIVERHITQDKLGFNESSIAEVFTLTPGVNIDRNGLSDSLSLRGLSAGYVSATFNGREQITASDSRNADLYLFPAELISNAEVQKSFDASQFVSGVAGVVSLNTASALEIGVPHAFKFDVKSRYNTMAKNIEGANAFGDRLSFLYQGGLLNNTLGIQFGYSTLSEEVAAAEYYAAPWGAIRSDDSVFLDGQEFSLSNNIEISQRVGEISQNAFIAAIHYRPNDNLEVIFDLLQSDFELKQVSHGYAIGRLSGFEISNYTFNGDDLIGGTFSLPAAVRLSGPSHGGNVIYPGEGFQLMSNDASTTTQLDTVGVDLKWADQRLELGVNLSRSAADSRDNNLVSSSHLYDVDPLNIDVDGNLILDSANRTNGLAFAYLNNASIPQLTFGPSVNFNNTDPALGPVVGLSSYVHTPDWREEELDAFSLIGEFKFENLILTSIESGVRLSNRSFVSGQEVFVYSIYDGDPSNQAAEPLPIYGDITGTASWNGSYSHFPSFPIFDATNVLLRYQSSDYLLDENGGVRDITPKSRWGEGRAWSMLEGVDIEEEVLSSFFKINFQGELFDKNISGNVGLQSVNTTVTSTSIVPADSSVVREAVEILDGEGLSIADVGLIGGTAYNEQLTINGAAYSTAKVDYKTNFPSLNLRYYLNEGNVFKFYMGKVMSRVPFSRLANDALERYNRVEAGDEVYFEYSVYAANSAALEPFEAMNYELAFDHFSEEKDFGYSLNYFAKELKNRLQTVSIDSFSGWSEFGFEPLRIYSDESGRDPNTGLPLPPSTYSVVDGDLTIAQNVNQSNYIHGLELEYFQKFTFLPEPFHTLAITANYVQLDGDIKVQHPYTSATYTQRIPGLIEKTIKAALFWECQNFTSKLSLVHEGEKNDSSYNATMITYDELSYIDVEFAYRFIEGLDAYFKVENLGNEQIVGYYDKKLKVATVQEFGRSFHLGLQYRF